MLRYCCTYQEPGQLALTAIGIRSHHLGVPFSVITVSAQLYWPYLLNSCMETIWFLNVQVNWLKTGMFYPDFWIYRTDFKGQVPQMHLSTNFSAYYGQFNPYLTGTGWFLRHALYTDCRSWLRRAQVIATERRNTILSPKKTKRTDN